MKITTFPIDCSYNDTIRIKPIGDTHIGHRLFDQKELEKFMSDRDDNTYFILLGDIVDSIIVSDTKRYRKSLDVAETDAIIDEQIDKAYDIFAPIKDRIIAIGTGNHEHEILKRCSTNATKRLAEKLNVPALGYSWMVRLSLKYNDGIRGSGRSVVIYGSHGYGGGARTEGGNLTKFSNEFKSYMADIYLFGHVHEKVYKNVPQGYHGGDKMKARDRLLCICGSFKRNLTDDNTTTWEESRGFPIRAIGGVTISITPDRDWVTMRAEG